ncbi:transporter substrate-binding domain-containing protein [Aurantimonas aggregata]|uniref:Transporter substrate-binding domain-containing protein n=1 Tax=Aurantimonas aggregata TaxID=2047720 RepID=A0A6L9ME28_9HYPH|nr:transporter substrate-binding domain-containing protein [Aurantimonas aggregata]NDV85916.1 transporter substrate-binding domain-containing protein [Aurantimonas aggregata]
MRENLPLKLILLVPVLCLMMLPLTGTSSAQTVATPNFYDQRQRMTKPDLGGRQRIRFLTTTDYPPFNFLDQRARLAGFNVDLVRAICEELDIQARCQIEAMPFGDLMGALQRGEGEAIVAGMAMTPTTRASLAFSEPYLRYPARFVTHKDRPLPSPIAEAIAGRTVGVEAGSAHGAMLGAFFPDATRQEFATRNEALTALKEGRIDTFFGDGVGLSFWLESDAAEACCVFSDGPFFSDRYLGEGLAIAVAPNDTTLARSIDYAIGQIVQKRRFSELLLRYFPVSPF